MGIVPSALRDCSTYQFQYASLSELEFHNKLSAEALDGVIKEFISRNGTDYGEFEASAEKKVKQVKQKLE